MEPKLPASNRGPEQAPVTFPQGLERAPLISSPEKILENKNERVEVRSEHPIQGTVQPILPPVQTPVPLVNDSDDNTVATDSTPLVAADDDLIEKEWVDKAKEIIVKTKDDPYQREREVSKLQADYLRKRYGKELGAA